MDGTGRGRSLRTGAAAAVWSIAIATSLAACSSVSLKEPPPVVTRSPQAVVRTPVPLPPLQPAPPEYAGSSPTMAASAPGASASGPVAVAVPVPSPSLAPPVPMVVAAPARPVSAAVAALFPEPAVSFATPAFAPGRTDVTSHAEQHELLRRVAFGSDRRTTIELLAVGTSGWGTPIEAIAFTRAPPPAVSAADVQHRPVVLLVGGQHGDEPATTEALIVIAQELAGGSLARVLDQVDVVVLPRANPDGADARQGPLASGLDLDADHLLLRSPEARAMAEVTNRFDPAVIIDLHEYAVDGRFEDKFGGVPRADLLLDYATAPNVAPFVTKAAEEWFREPLAKSLATAGYSSDWAHSTSADLADRRVSMGGIGVGIARNAGGLRNAVSLSLASRRGGAGRADLRRRVQAQVLAVSNLLASAARRAADLGKLRQFVERDLVAQACRGEAVLAAAPTSSEHSLGLLDPQTGVLKRVPVTWESSLQLRVLTLRPRPCGYWLAGSELDAVDRLQALGIDVQRVDEAGDFRGQTYRETGVAEGGAADPSAGLKVQMQPALVDAPTGSFYVSLEQPLANLAVAALEPEAPGSYTAQRVIDRVGAVARVLSRPTFRMSDAR